MEGGEAGVVLEGQAQCRRGLAVLAEVDAVVAEVQADVGAKVARAQAEIGVQTARIEQTRWPGDASQ